MSHVMKQLFVFAGIFAAVFAIAKLPVEAPLVGILIALALIVLAVINEYPRWRHPFTKRWPNKLGER